MANIDSLEEIRKLDIDNYLQTLRDFPEQCERAWSDWEKIPLPARFIQAKNILITGMGGSAIGARLASGLITQEKIPIIIRGDYGSPDWVNKDTLVIASSYSGNTEETLDCFEKSAQKTDKLITISKGGQLEILSRKYKTTHYTINYDSQPRQSIGFQLTSILAILRKLDLIELTPEDFKEAVLLVRSLQKKIDVSAATYHNNSKILAKKLIGKIPIIFGSGILAEVARRAKSHFNENSKVASYFEILPEANHNAMVGLEFPKPLKDKIHVIILQSKYDHPRNQLRDNITFQIMQKKRIPSDSIMFEPSTGPLAELLQALHFVDFTSYYLGILNDAEPSRIDMILFLKDKLAEHPFDSSPSTSLGTSQGKLR